MISKPPACGDCALAVNFPHLGFVPPDPDGHQELDIWGEAGGVEEADAGRGFVGRSGRKLRGLVGAAGVGAFRARNVCCCRPPGNDFPSDEIARACLERHQPGALTAPPERPWLMAGANATRNLTGYDLNPLDVRGSVMPLLNGGWAVATFHPAFLLYVDENDPTKKGNPDMEPLLSLDVKRALRDREPRVPQIKVCSASTVQALLKDGARVSVDIEGGEPAPSVVGFAFSRDEAFVVPWSFDCVALLQETFARMTPIFHNASYDVGELAAIGLSMPKVWFDTINLAALADPGLAKGLGKQVLTWVPGTTAWKGLVTHGNHQAPKAQPVLRAMWREILTRLGRAVPDTEEAWLCHYNGLDAAWTYGLAEALRKEIGPRWTYVQQLIVPLQRPLIELGMRGLPYDPSRMAYHQGACSRLVRMAQRQLAEATQPVVDALFEEPRRLALEQIAILEAERATEGGRKFSKAAELSKLRGDVRKYDAHIEEGFNFDSYPQRSYLLFNHFQLPYQPSTGDKVIESLLRRLTRKDEDNEGAPSIKSKGAPIEVVVRTLHAVRAAKTWRTWGSSYDPDSAALIPSVEPTRRPRVRCAYSQHRVTTGRLSSGADTSDVDKGTRRKRSEFHAQNVPKALRDAFVADPGYVMLGADWKALQWALAMWDASRLPGSNGFHLKLLEAQQAGTFDPHRYLAAHVYKVQYDAVQSWQRQIAKGYTFGRLFLGGPVGLSREAGHTVTVGRRVCAAYDPAFKLKEWWDYILGLCKRKRHVQTELGWRRYFEWNFKPNEALATRIQALEGDLMKWVARSIFEDHPGWYEPLTLTHDAVVGQCPVENAEVGKAYLKSKMEQRIEWLGGRSWLSTIKVGPNWRSVS